MPQTRRRIGDRAFSVAAPRAWNRLPTELKLLRSTDSFHRHLKTFLFHSIYGHQDTHRLCDAPSLGLLVGAADAIQVPQLQLQLQQYNDTVDHTQPFLLSCSSQCLHQAEFRHSHMSVEPSTTWIYNCRSRPLLSRRALPEVRKQQMHHFTGKQNMFWSLNLSSCTSTIMYSLQQQVQPRRLKISHSRYMYI